MRLFINFTASRVICAFISYALYLFLLMLITYELAYVVSYVIGVALAYFINAEYVFKQTLNQKALILFTLTYVVQFLITLVLLKFFVDSLGIPDWLALGLCVIIILPATYLMSKWSVSQH